MHKRRFPTKINVQSNLVITNTLNANVCLTQTIFPVFVGINVVLTSLLITNTDIENFRLARTVYTFKLEENSTLSMIIKNKDSIIEAYEQSSFAPSKKRMRSAAYPEVEEALVSWLKFARSHQFQDLFFKQKPKNSPLNSDMTILSAVWVGSVDSKSVTISFLENCAVKVQSWMRKLQAAGENSWSPS